MQTVSGLFDSYADASAALRDLHTAGVANADLSVVSGDQSAAEPAKPSHVALDSDEGADSRPVLGGAGGLLAGLGVIAVPGVGQVLAGGWLLATAADVAVGRIAGGIIDAMVAGGVPEADAQVYAEGLRRGGTLVSTRIEDGRTDRVKAVLDDNDAVDIAARREDFEREGWSGFDAAGAPLTTVKRAATAPAAIS